MIYSQKNRQQLRQLYVDSWYKFNQNLPMTNLETQIAKIIKLHPEYHRFINHSDIDKDFTPESGFGNPFLHMGLHMSLIEQIATNRPLGISHVYKLLCDQYGGEHKVQHLCMNVLGEIIFYAQKNNSLPDEQEYYSRIKAML